MQQMDNIPQPWQPGQDYSGPEPHYNSQPPEPENPINHPVPKSPKEGWRSVASTVALLAAAPLIALLLINYVFQSYQVDGPSMEASLQHEDRLVVLKVGKTWARLTDSSFIPKRGEIVVFDKSGLGSSSNEKQLIKRVIALPGERVVIRDGIVTVYNDSNPDGFNPDQRADYGTSILSTNGSVDLTVPNDHIFVCGDNRSNSLDSRDFGTVPAQNIVGTLALRIFPLNKLEAY